MAVETRVPTRVVVFKSNNITGKSGEVCRKLFLLRTFTILSLG